MANNHSAEWLRGAIEALDRARRDFTVTVPELQAEYVALLAAAEAREAFPIPDTLPEVPEARETGESDSIKLAKLIDGMFYCEGGGYDSDDVREGIQKAFKIGVQSAGKTETSEAGESNAAEVLRRGGSFEEVFTATDIGAQALEAWAWVERHIDDIDIRGDRSAGDGWVTVTYNDGNRAEGATVYAAVLDAMEKERKG